MRARQVGDDLMEPGATPARHGHREIGCLARADHLAGEEVGFRQGCQLPALVDETDTQLAYDGERLFQECDRLASVAVHEQGATHARPREAT